MVASDMLVLTAVPSFGVSESVAHKTPGGLASLAFVEALIDDATFLNCSAAPFMERESPTVRKR